MNDVTEDPLYSVIQVLVYVLYLRSAQVSHGVEKSSLASVIYGQRLYFTWRCAQRDGDGCFGLCACHV